MNLDWNRSYDGWKVQDSWQILVISSNNKIEYDHSFVWHHEHAERD